MNPVHGSRCLSAGLSFCDKSPYSEEPREGKTLTRGSEVAAGRATVPPTITWAALRAYPNNPLVEQKLLYLGLDKVE
jgi:hypothetical protein